MSLSLPQGIGQVAAQNTIEQIENRVHAKQAPAIGTYLFELPRAFDSVPEVIILPFAILSGPTEIVNVELNVSTDDGLLIKPKTYMMMDDVKQGFATKVTLQLGSFKANTRTARSIYLQLPKKYAKSECWFTKADFVEMKQTVTKKELIVQSNHYASIGKLTVCLNYQDVNGVKHELCSVIPIQALPSDEYSKIKTNIFGGQHHALSTRIH